MYKTIHSPQSIQINNNTELRAHVLFCTSSRVDSSNLASMVLHLSLLEKVCYCPSSRHDRSGCGPCPHAILYHRRDVSPDAVEEIGEPIHGAGDVVGHSAEDQVERLLQIALQRFVEDSLPEASVDQAAAWLVLAQQRAPGAHFSDEYCGEQRHQQNQRAGPSVPVRDHDG